MGEFICVCAIDMCEIKAAAVSVCNTRTRGWGFSIHPRIATRVEKGLRNAVPDGGLWEARGDGMGVVSLGPILLSGWWPHCTHTLGMAPVLPVRLLFIFTFLFFLLHSSCLTFISSRFACMEWDF